MTPDEQLRQDRYRDSYTKRNTEFQKVISVIISMDTAIIGVPIIFFKDIFSSVPHNNSIFGLIISQCAAIAILFAIAVISLSSSIYYGTEYYYHSGEHIHRLYTKEIAEYMETENARKRVRNLNRTYDLCRIFFGIGFFMMFAFILFYKI